MEVLDAREATCSRGCERVSELSCVQKTIYRALYLDTSFLKSITRYVTELSLLRRERRQRELDLVLSLRSSLAPPANRLSTYSLHVSSCTRAGSSASFS